MAITPSIAVSQSAVSPQNVSVLDDSSGSDVAIASRRLYITDANGEPLIPAGTTTDYIVWPYTDSTITVNVLQEDTAVNIRVDWLNSGNSVLYTYNNTYPLSEFGHQFFYYLIQLQGLKPGVYQDSNYSGNIALFWANLVGGDNAVTYGNDIKAAQNCYNREIEMMQNQAKYFGSGT